MAVESLHPQDVDCLQPFYGLRYSRPFAKVTFTSRVSYGTGFSVRIAWHYATTLRVEIAELVHLNNHPASKSFLACNDVVSRDLETRDAIGCPVDQMEGESSLIILYARIGRALICCAEQPGRKNSEH